MRSIRANIEISGAGNGKNQPSMLLLYADTDPFKSLHLFNSESKRIDAIRNADQSTKSQKHKTSIATTKYSLFTSLSLSKFTNIAPVSFVVAAIIARMNQTMKVRDSDARYCWMCDRKGESADEGCLGASGGVWGASRGVVGVAMTG